jgi:pyruvate formate lyase activating enzyme
MSEGIARGVIFNIQRFSLHDGEGIRTLVFMKGCPLRCRWCSNPEGLRQDVEIMDNPAVCVGCGACFNVCPEKAVCSTEGFPIDRNKCTGCGLCAQYCPANAKTVSGESKTVDDVMGIVERDMPFYGDSDGGITVGGGEMLAQDAFVAELLRRCRGKGINTAVETSGYGSWDGLARIAAHCDSIHYDIKALDPARHQYCTGADNSLILQNLQKLDAYLSEIHPMPKLILRVPMVPGYNLTEEFIEEAAAYIKTGLRNFQQVELLPFHNFGEQKYKKLGIPYELDGRPNIKPEEAEQYLAFFEKEGLPVSVSKW